jgi:hypothetical protein
VSNRLSAADLINLAVETPDTPMHVGALAMLDGRSLCDEAGRLRLAEIRAALEASSAAVPQLRRVVHVPGPLAGRPRWVDDPTFRIDRHVDQVAVPPPADEAALLDLVERLLAAPLDRSRPLWRMWFVTGLPDGRVAMLVALHHAIADGLAAVQLLTSLLDQPARAARPAAVPPWRDRHRGPRRGGTIRAGWQVFTEARGAPRTSLNAPVGGRRRLAVLRLDLADAKRVAHASGGKLNDVVLSLMGGGLGSLLRSRGEPVDGVRLHTGVAVSLRPAGERVEAGNRSGAIMVRLPIGEPDPAVRLRAVCAETARVKDHQVAAYGQRVVVLLARLGLLRAFARRQHMTNVVESNVTGPVTPIRVLGAPVLDLVAIGTLVGNLALSFLALSYAGRLSIAVRADADLFPDLPVLLAAMRRDWEALVNGGAGEAAQATDPVAEGAVRG